MLLTLINIGTNTEGTLVDQIWMMSFTEICARRHHQHSSLQEQLQWTPSLIFQSFWDFYASSHLSGWEGRSLSLHWIIELPKSLAFSKTSTSEISKIFASQQRSTSLRVFNLSLGKIYRAFWEESPDCGNQQGGRCEPLLSVNANKRIIVQAEPSNATRMKITGVTVLLLLLQYFCQTRFELSFFHTLSPL